MKTRRKGLTIIEMITVLAIIMILAGLLVPAVNMVRKKAKETQQRSQIAVITLGLEAWKEDFGIYPDSNEYTTGTSVEATYTGAQKLAEAMVGRDLRGFHSQADLSNATGVPGADPESEDYYLMDGTNYSDDVIQENLELRLDPYIDIETARAYSVSSSSTQGLFDKADPLNLATDTVTICDVFDRFSVTLSDGTVLRAGMPLLYFRANPSNTLSEVDDYYDFGDNYAMVEAAQNAAELDGGFLEDPDVDFYEFIRNPAVGGSGTYPYNADSFLLISAGLDGIYGTRDDITNFN